MEATVRKTGWVTLVGILFLIAGGFDLIWGLVAVGVSLGGTAEIAHGDLSNAELEGLGIAGLIVGAIQVFVGAGILSRSPSARVIGMLIAVIAILINFGYHNVLDGWAWSGLFINFVILLILSLRHEEFHHH